VRVRLFELRLLAVALTVLWAAGGGIVLIGYRPGGPWDLLVGMTAALPLLVKPPAVVLESYVQWYRHLVGPAQIRHTYRDAWTIWELVSPPVNTRLYEIAQLGAAAVAALVDDLLPAIRVDMVDRPLHDTSLADLRRIGGGTSLVDRVTLAFAARHGIARAFAYDADLAVAGLVPVTRDP